MTSSGLSCPRLFDGFLEDPPIDSPMMLSLYWAGLQCQLFFHVSFGFREELLLREEKETMEGPVLDSKES